MYFLLCLGDCDPVLGWTAERSVRARFFFAISVLNLDTVGIMNGFLYLYELEGIDSQGLEIKCYKLETSVPWMFFHDVLIKQFTDTQMIYNSG